MRGYMTVIASLVCAMSAAMLAALAVTRDGSYVYVAGCLTAAVGCAVLSYHYAPRTRAALRRKAAGIERNKV